MEENVEKIEKSEIELLKEENEKLKQEVEDWKKEYTIKLADFENYKKRLNKELDDFKKFASKDIVLKVLENISVLENVVNYTVEEESNKSIIDGIKMMINNIMEYLKTIGLEEIDNSIAFDPNLHHAVMTDNVEDKENDEILEVFQKGYKLNGRIIKASMVKINKK